MTGQRRLLVASRSQFRPEWLIGTVIMDDDVRPLAPRDWPQIKPWLRRVIGPQVTLTPVIRPMAWEVSEYSQGGEG